MLDNSICCFKGVQSRKYLLANNADPGQMSHHVVSDLGLQFAFDPFTGFPVRMG